MSSNILSLLGCRKCQTTACAAPRTQGFQTCLTAGCQMRRMVRVWRAESSPTGEGKIEDRNIIRKDPSSKKALGGNSVLKVWKEKREKAAGEADHGADYFTVNNTWHVFWKESWHKISEILFPHKRHYSKSGLLIHTLKPYSNKASKSARCLIWRPVPSLEAWTESSWSLSQCDFLNKQYHQSYILVISFSLIIPSCAPCCRLGSFQINCNFEFARIVERILAFILWNHLCKCMYGCMHMIQVHILYNCRKSCSCVEIRKQNVESQYFWNPQIWEVECIQRCTIIFVF